MPSTIFYNRKDLTSLSGTIGWEVDPFSGYKRAYKTNDNEFHEIVKKMEIIMILRKGFGPPLN
jgi:hypothetical protein